MLNNNNNINNNNNNKNNNNKNTFHLQALHSCSIVIYAAEVLCGSPQRNLRTQNLNSHLLRTQNLQVLPLKPRVCQCIATHSTLTARDFFLANFYPSGPFTCVFFLPQTSPAGSCVGQQNKLGHAAHRYRQLMQVPVLSARSKIGVIVFSEIVFQNCGYNLREKESCSIMTCGMTMRQIEVCFQP